MGNKWFDPKPRVINIHVMPADKYTRADVNQLFKEIQDKKLPEQFTNLIINRLGLDNYTRLVVNTQVLLGIARNKLVDTVIPDGLTTTEHALLVELERKNYSYMSKIIAHSLLNVNERVAQLNLLHQLTATVRERNDCVVKVESI